MFVDFIFESLLDYIVYFNFNQHAESLMFHVSTLTFEIILNFWIVFDQQLVNLSLFTEPDIHALFFSTIHVEIFHSACLERIFIEKWISRSSQGYRVLISTILSLFFSVQFWMLIIMSVHKQLINCRYLCYGYSWYLWPWLHDKEIRVVLLLLVEKKFSFLYQISLEIQQYLLKNWRYFSFLATLSEFLKIHKNMVSVIHKKHSIYSQVDGHSEPIQASILCKNWSSIC